MNLRDEALEHGLSSEEFDLICSLLHRDPNQVELGIFAVMWSEHCSYKSTRKYLRNLPTTGPHVILGPGENAGVIDLDGTHAVCFKVESHNHPSFIEPFQGAATGVGGILRDIFTMGARPIAVLDSLHFGEESHPKVPHLLKGVVSGISHYGNCMGIPTVNGETKFDSCYDGNNLVNAMAVGVCKINEIYTAKAEGVGNIVLYLGSKTGKDGIHGATMASEEFDEESEDKRPTVQVGDPFMEKLVMEATLEMIQKKLLVAIQDMGAAGIACSTFEMSSKGQCGMEINLDLVPLREKNTSAYEIFLSESQERMLAVVHPERLDEVLEVAKKWGVDSAAIGKIIAEPKVLAYHHGEKVVDLPVEPVSSKAPVYDRPIATGKIFDRSLDANSCLRDFSIKDIVHKLLESGSFAEKEYIYQQYDHSVGADTLIGPGADASVLRVKDSKHKVGVVLKSLAHLCQADPHKGMQHLVSYCIQSLASVGAKAVATTNCLNFGNPQEPEIMDQIRISIESLGESCAYFQTPITGGNASLYNQTDQTNILPTPSVGMVGIVEPGAPICHPYIHESGLHIGYVGTAQVFDRLYQSLVARKVLGEKELMCPPIDLAQEKRLQKTLLALIHNQSIQHSCVVRSGGVFKSLTAMLPKIGCKIQTPDGIDPNVFLFGEFAGAFLVAAYSEKIKAISDHVQNSGLSFYVLGESGGSEIDINGQYKESIKHFKSSQKAFWKGLS
ncbi:MAG: phosphoribosylformylglycinamidine synthase subunit PurL [Bdellovibrionota bacterium]